LAGRVHQSPPDRSDRSVAHDRLAGCLVYSLLVRGPAQDPDNMLVEISERPSKQVAMTIQ